MLSAARLVASDLLAIERQASQQLHFGVPVDIDADDAAERADDPVAWTLRQAQGRLGEREGRIVACLGIAEPFPGAHGLAWAVLAPGIGGLHHALTRFARAVVEDAAARLNRIEAIVAVGAPERWARLIGLPPVHLLRNFGAGAEPYWLCERINARERTKTSIPVNLTDFEMAHHG